jgi:hypothetical protein
MMDIFVAGVYEDPFAERGQQRVFPYPDMLYEHHPRMANAPPPAQSSANVSRGKTFFSP